MVSGLNTPFVLHVFVSIPSGTGIHCASWTVCHNSCIIGISILLEWSIPGVEVIKLFSCSAQLRLKFILLINVKMPTFVGILTFMSRINY